jgi:hypothetical protein
MLFPRGKAPQIAMMADGLISRRLEQEGGYGWIFEAAEGTDPFTGRIGTKPLNLPY